MIDILFPTKGENIKGIEYSINSILSQTYDDFILHILIDEPVAWIYEKYSKNEKIHIDIIPDKYVKENKAINGNHASKWALEEMELSGDWIYQMSDNDIIMPFALEYLINNSNNCSMVIGRAIGIGQNSKAMRIELGKNIRCGLITGGVVLIKKDDMRKLEKPYCITNIYEVDFYIINKMAEKYPFKMIDSLVLIVNL